MGNTNSAEEGRHRFGYHVLRVKDGSPAQSSGIRPYFDYIVAINGVRLNVEGTQFQDEMLANEDKPVVLDVYSTREQAGRRVQMVPTKKWGDGSGGLIGCRIRFCMFDAANDVVWHILDVTPGSPAEKAGLCAHTDYVIGTPYGIMRGEGDLYDLVEENIGEPLRLHVYNSQTDHVREIVIIPNEEWGGDGLLGCDVGYGYLHRLPRKDLATQQGSGGNSMRTPSLPYPQSQDIPLDVVNRSNSLPVAFQPGEQPDIVAPTPRPSQSPSWLNPSEMLESSLHKAPKANAAPVEQEPDLPPLRFGRGERPDAEDEPESEDDFVPKRSRSIAQQEPTSVPVQPTSPTILKQLQAVALQERPQLPQQPQQPQQQQPQHHQHQHHQHQHQHHPPTQPNTTLYQGPRALNDGQSINPQQPPLPTTASGSQPHSQPTTRSGEVNTGDIPFGSESGSDFANQLGIFQQQQQ